MVDGAGTYDVLEVSGSGLVTEHVAGTGTMAGPPARLTNSVLAGRALASDVKVAAMSRLFEVGSIISSHCDVFSGAGGWQFESIGESACV